MAFHVVWDYPTYLAPHRVLRGWASDELFFCWDLWWVSTSFWDLPGVSVAHTPFLFAPQGAPYFASSHVWLYGMVYTIAQAPWRWIPALGAPPSVVLGYNALTLLSSALTGLAVVATCRRFHSIRFPFALLAGFTVAFCDFRLFSLFGHLNYVGMEFLLWGVWALTAAAFDSSPGAWRWWALGGFFAALTWLNSYYYGIFIGLFWFYALMWNVRSAPKGTRVRAFNRAWITWAVVAVVAGYPLFQMARIFFSFDYAVEVDTAKRSCDLFHFLFPSGYHRLLGGVAYQWSHRLEISPDFDLAFLGWTTYWVMGWGVGVWIATRRRGEAIFRSPRARFWAWLAVGAFVLALGERLRVLGIQTIDLPAAALFKLPILDNIRTPERLLVFVFLPVGILSAALAQHLADRMRFRTLTVFVAGWVVLFLLSSAYTQPHIDTRAVPYSLPAPVLDVIRAPRPDPKAFTVWTLPVSYDHRLPLFWQTSHLRPIPFGASSRRRESLKTWRAATYSFLAAVEENHSPSLARSVGEAGSTEALRRQTARFVQDHRVGYILLRKDLWPEGKNWLETALPGASIRYSDARFLVIEPAPPSPSTP